MPVLTPENRTIRHRTGYRTIRHQQEAARPVKWHVLSDTVSCELTRTIRHPSVVLSDTPHPRQPLCHKASKNRNARARVFNFIKPLTSRACGKPKNLPAQPGTYPPPSLASPRYAAYACHPWQATKGILASGCGYFQRLHLRFSHFPPIPKQPAKIQASLSASADKHNANC